jgi:hypothetical protein
MNRRRTLVGATLAAGLLIGSSLAGADTIYKHIDEKGNVTYSSSPPKGAGKMKKLDVPDKPSAGEVAAARRQLEEDKRQLETYDAERRRQEAERVKLQQERAARDRAEIPATPVAVDDPPVYYPAWGYRPPLRPVIPWPQPNPPAPTPLPANPSPPLMAPPIRPVPQPQ